MLFEVYWNLVDAKGSSADRLDATQFKGNIIAMQILIGGLCASHATLHSPVMLSCEQTLICTREPTSVPSGLLSLSADLAQTLSRKNTRMASNWEEAARYQVAQV
jgi:Fungalysin metallopeptidase (M36)